MNKQRLLAIGLFAGFGVLGSTAALAASPSFDFIEGGYTSSRFDGLSKNLTGPEYRANLSFKEHYYVAADYSKVGPAADGNGFKENIMSLGLGYKYDWSDNTALYSEIDGIVYDPDGHNTHVHGVELTLGVRSHVSERLELKAAAELLDAERFSRNSVLLGAAYNLTRHIAIYSDVRFADDATRTSVGARLTF